ncbi:hypothetical protein B7463_g5521, partial [Scytalidium lignicola]
MAETVSGIASSPLVKRKKFAVPPVKLACLECRAARTRCDGKQTCSNCLSKGKACTYLPSRRGGSRIRKKLPSPSTSPSSSSSPPGQGPKPPSPISNANFMYFNQPLPDISEASNIITSPQSLAEPGAGLWKLDSISDNSDFIFDSIFSSQFDGNTSVDNSSGQKIRSPNPECGHPIVRTYANDEDIIKAPDFEPSSPLSLAISASLALIPHPDDPNPTSPESVLLRRAQAHAFSQSALESIEIESELVNSTTHPEDALSSGPPSITRKPFHPQVRLENESIIAFLLLSTYEYGQRGNITKMRTRAGQALVAAMGLGLHARGGMEDRYAESDRRVWWMTYVCVCQGFILSNTSPTILLYDPRFTTVPPTFSPDPDSWMIFVQAQQAIVSATQFVIDLQEILRSKADITPLWKTMLELESRIEQLINKTAAWIPESFTASPELAVTQALRGMARIKLNSARIKVHRYCAFSDRPIFSKKHCDLAYSSDPTMSKDDMSLLCSCTATYPQPIYPIDDLSISPSSTYSSLSPASNSSFGILPFSSHYSAKICLKAAFNISRAFKALPFPPSVNYKDNICSPSQRPIELPRMVPIFACCAMQSTYAMVMLSYKMQALGLMGPLDDGSNLRAKRLLVQLRDGLQLIFNALRNYSIAYEALGGMRDQVKEAVDSVSSVYKDISLLMGALSNSGRKAANFVGFYKGLQSDGAAVMWAYDSTNPSFMSGFASNWALLLAALVISSPTIFLRIKDYVSTEEGIVF